MFGVAGLVALPTMEGIRFQIDAASRTIGKSGAAIRDALTLFTDFVGGACLVTGTAMSWIVSGIDAGFCATH